MSRFDEPSSFLRHKVFTETKHPRRPSAINNGLEQKLPTDVIYHIVNNYDVDHCDPEWYDCWGSRDLL